MNAKQIEIYKYCQEDLDKIKEWEKKLPFGIQNHGCGSQRPAIEFELEKIHKEMYLSVISAIEFAKININKKIESI